MSPRQALSADELLSYLRVPPLEGQTLSLCLPTVAAVNEALQSLRASSKEDIHTLTQGLKEVARLDVEPQLKLDLLALFTTRVNRFTATLGQAQLDDSAAALIATSITMLKQLSLGYKSTLAVLLETPDNRDKRLLGRALSGCLDSLGVTYLRSLQLHLPAPGNLWEELNALYRLCSLLEMRNAKFRMIDSAFKPELSLEDRYVRTLLLACAHPYQYENHELEHIHEALAHWSPLVNLVPAPEEGMFLIDVSSSEGPFLATRQHHITSSMLWIRTSRLVRQLREQSSTSTLPRGQLTPAAVQKLCNTFGQEYCRNEDRVTILGDMELVAGLGNVHALINADSCLSPPGRLSASQWLPGVPRRAPTPVAAKEVNISKRGSCIELEPPVAEQLAPGDVVAMRRSQRASWSIAMVRWKRAKADFSARFGLEIIARHAVPGALREAGRHDATWHSALLLRDTDQEGPWQLLTRASHAGHNAALEVLAGQHNHNITLGPAELVTASLSLHSLPAREFAPTAVGPGT